MNADVRRRAERMVVEIVGVAGSGKSTLAGHLVEPGRGAQFIDDMRLKDPAHARVIARHAWAALPLIVPTGRPWLGWTETKLVLYLEAWGDFIERLPEEPGVAVADQGPVYAMARILVNGGGFLEHRRFRPWYDRTMQRWARTMDLLVWLDAPNETLRQRIDGRDQDHSTKHADVAESDAFLGAYRAAFERVLADLTRFDGPGVLRLDTSRHSAADVVDLVTDRINAGRSR